MIYNDVGLLLFIYRRGTTATRLPQKRVCNHVCGIAKSRLRGGGGGHINNVTGYFRTKRHPPPPAITSPLSRCKTRRRKYIADLPKPAGGNPRPLGVAAINPVRDGHNNIIM